MTQSQQYLAAPSGIKPGRRIIRLGKMIFFRVIDPSGDDLPFDLVVGTNYIGIDGDGHAYLGLGWHITRFAQAERPLTGFKVWK